MKKLLDRSLLAGFLNSIKGIEIITDPEQVGRLSLDYYHFSPVLIPQLQDKRADVIVRPQTEAEVIKVAHACAEYQVPLTIRGAGTGNYGQCVPLRGGIVMDMTKLASIEIQSNGIAQVQAGARLINIEKQARQQGWELRMFPSTLKTATIGGFIAGGSGGIGSLRYGQLRDRGNVRSARIITIETLPQIMHLEGEQVQQINHAYGTNGIITELGIPLAPAILWIETIVVFDDFMTCAHFGNALGKCDGITCRMISVHEHPIPAYFSAMADSLPRGCHCALVLVANTDYGAFAELVAEWGGTITYQQPAGDRGLSLVEFSWNHTTLHARAVDPQITYLQSLFVHDPDLQLIQHLTEHFAGEVFMHLEFIRMGGKVVPAGIQLLKFTTVDRLQEIIDYHEQKGVLIANPHTYILEDGGMKTVDQRQLEFKRRADPHNLLNIGKTRTVITSGRAGSPIL